MEFSAGTTSLRDLAIASRMASSSARAASASTRSDATLAASSFLVLRLRLGGGDEVRDPSRMTRAPLLRLGGADDGSRLTVLGVDADDRDADLADMKDADPEETDAIRRGIQELPRRRDSVGRGGGDISRSGEFPRSMCARTVSRVRPGALHQRRRLAALLRAGGGGVSSYAASSCSYLHRKNAVHAWRLSG
jgi:hypothetical protein